MESSPPKSSLDHQDSPSRRPPHSGRQQSQQSQAQSSTSSDSQPVLVSNPASSPATSPKPKISRHLSTPRNRPTDDEPRRCWICFEDETEDTPNSTSWRSPCPCALTAHESCLLDWIADLEAPNRKGKRGSKIQCPQCKAEITVARPRSWAVEIVRAVERVMGKLVFPVLTASVLSSVIMGLTVHGAYTVRLVFGKQDMLTLWYPQRTTFSLGQLRGPPLSFGLSLPLIPIVLVLSRTTIADSVLPLLPLAYLAGRRSVINRPSLWPPSAGMTIATLPFIRAFYNALHRRYVLPRQKAWLKEIQPRSDEGSDGDVDQGDADLEDREVGDGEGIVDIELGVDIVMHDDQEAAEAQHRDANAEHQPPLAAQEDGPAENVGAHAGVQDDAQNQGPAAPQQQHNAPQPPVIDAGAFPALANRQQNIILSTTRLGDLIVGALLYPAVSAAMGQLIALTFPRSWVVPPSGYERGPRGILQNQWGRSIIGGCAFIVMKDVVLGYSRWRLARDHRRRRIIDYKDKKEKGVVR